MTRRKIAIFVLIVAVVVGGGFGLCSWLVAPGAPTANQEVVEVQRGNLETTISTTGNLAMPYRAKLTFDIDIVIDLETMTIESETGTVQRVYVETGDSVEQGEILAFLDDMTFIFAPFNGVIAYVGAKAGDEVTDDTVIVVMYNPHIVELDAIVDELDISQVERGQEARVTIDALPDVEFSGLVTEVTMTPIVQEWIVGYPVAIRLQLAGEYQLLEGLSASADIIVGQAENVLLIPDRAIKTSGGRQLVQVVVGGGTEEREIQTGLSDGQWTEVTGGLHEGERVVVR